MLEGRRCGVCGQIIQGPRATVPQTKYCAQCAKRRIRRSVPKGGPISHGKFESSAVAPPDVIEDLRAESDRLLTRMQTRRARTGMSDAFSASPTELGRAAVNGSRKRR